MFLFDGTGFEMMEQEMLKPEMKMIWLYTLLIELNFESVVLRLVLKEPLCNAGVHTASPLQMARDLMRRAPGGWLVRSDRSIAHLLHTARLACELNYIDPMTSLIHSSIHSSA